MKIVRGKHFSEPPVVRTNSNGAPVYAYGYTYISSEAPDLTNDATLQDGNENAITKIQLKHSDEIKSNYVGINTTRVPRVSENEYLPVECVNLIDGNPMTCWLSKTQSTSTLTPVWIRLDFPIERKCNRIVLRKLPVIPGRNREYTWGLEGEGAVDIGRGMPKHLTVEFSVDGWHWDKVFEGETNDTDDKEFFEIKTDLRPVRMVRITGTKLIMVENLMFCFSIANVEVYDENDTNVALVSKGVGVQVNSTTHSHGMEMEVQRTLFPIHYDIGAKWLRIGFHDDVINWHWVEREKGILKIDPYADATITEMYDNGIEIIMCLNFGNRLYTGQPRVVPQLWEFNYDPATPPKTEEALEAWGNYCRFMVRHFKDRVNYFEIWNEWTNYCYWCDAQDIELYLKLARIAMDIIRKEAPEAKIVMGSLNGFPHGISRWDEKELETQRTQHRFMVPITRLAKEVDVIGYHPFYNSPPKNLHNYDADISAFKRFCENEGFQGTYSASEYNFSNTVTGYEADMWWGHFRCTELDKAVYVARTTVLHTYHAVSSIFCATNSSTHPLDLSLFRRATIQDPVDARQPQAAFYVMRNLSTYLDGVEGYHGEVEVSGAKKHMVQKPFIRGEERLYALWYDELNDETFAGDPVDLTIEGEYKEMTGFDPVNGVEQRLDFSVENGKTRVRNWMLKDYPTFLRGFM